MISFKNGRCVVVGLLIDKAVLPGELPFLTITLKINISLKMNHAQT